MPAFANDIAACGAASRPWIIHKSPREPFQVTLGSYPRERGGAENGCSQMPQATKNGYCFGT